ncbi:unnamed protein product [Rotaria sordida]|uniref:F-box domain-containing protein n=1 Tax=Rotaria sordida TaxID=392033 RepID=A0A816FUW6_9BILA|nr:unnamed protein product [Rotaria sordida]CAF1665822.1 unnamed protein product [Rotaria sordida]
MEYSCIGLNDLPDEILMIIFKKLNNFDVLYSLHGVNQRLNQIIQDRIFTSRLICVKWFSNNFTDLISCDMILNRFRLQILPEIHDKIQWLDLESSSMKYILRTAHYPNLYGLGLYNINEESARCLFTGIFILTNTVHMYLDEILSSGIFTNQITTLFITMDKNNNYDEMLLSVGKICVYIFNVFTRLIALTFYESSYRNPIRLCFNDPLPSNIYSSSVSILNIRVQCFDDCLYLLDGRFNQLHTLYVDLVNLSCLDETENQGNLPNLRCFFLSCNLQTLDYDNTILPLLYRMSNLEVLGLCFMICPLQTIIDGNHLKRHIINRMLRLNQFTFYISSLISIDNEMNLPSREDIQRTFIDFTNSEIISYVDYFPEKKKARCHIYSYPSFMPYYSSITNNFPGGLFKYVRIVALYDEYPFEHEFFLRIVQSFPYMQELYVENHKSQNHKQSYESSNDNQNLSVIEYCFLSDLRIMSVHDDYIKEFLFNTKASLPNNVTLRIKYESLQRVTHNFTRDATRINCAKIDRLDLYGESKRSNSLQEYFPNADITF